MIRKIIKIDEDKCTGCGLCVSACAEGALQLVDGKARLVKESYCDGLGACLPKCPVDAIEIEEREADAFDEKEVARHLAAAGAPVHAAAAHGHQGHACPGSALRQMKRTQPPLATARQEARAASELGHWPVQLMLVPPGAPFLKGADIVVSADCVPFAYPSFHARYLRGRALLVGCPKLDDIEYYAEKLKDIIREAAPRSLTVVRMQVPCCGGIASAVVAARDEVSPEVPVTIETISIEGNVIRVEEA